MNKISKTHFLSFIEKNKNVLFAILYILLFHALLHPQIGNYIGRICFFSIFYLSCLFFSLKFCLKENNKKNLFFISASFLLLCVNSISILSMPRVINLPYYQSFSLTCDFILSSLSESFKHASILLVCFVFFDNLIKEKISKKILFIFTIAYGFLNILVSIVCNFNSYIYVLQNFQLFGSYRITSFSIMHSSGFAYILLIASIATMFFSNYIRNSKVQLCLIPFGIFMGFSGDKTGICLFLFLILIYYILKCYFFIKKPLFRTAFISLIALLIITTSLLIILNGNPVHDFIFEKFNNFATIRSRIAIWKNTIIMLLQNPVSIVFGYSYGIFNSCLNITYTHSPDFNDSPGINTCHNMFMDDLGTGGILFLLIDLLVICYIFRRFFKNNSQKYKCIIFGFFFISIFFAENLLVTYGILIEAYALVTPIYYITICLFTNIKLPINATV